jgi:alpha-mannosidase
VKLRLDAVADDGACVVLRGRLPTFGARPDVAPRSLPVALRFRTRTGALLRIDGATRGAFDRLHDAIVVDALPGADLTLEVEKRALPTNGLPGGDGLIWRAMLARSAQTPARTIEATLAPASVTDGRHSAFDAEDALALVGHAHLDVAWLWTYEEAARKAQRTFATAVRQLETDEAFVFAQSQPQLYAFVAERDPELFARVCALARTGRFDASGAAMWVEPDCNLPSGESLVRQLVVGIRFVEAACGVTPSVAWLPDTFGFANTLPTLLAHAGVGAFATTKLGWNDTTRFPHARFVWEGPDGSRVLAAQIASIAGDLGAQRVRTARRRGDLLLVGHGDGGGGARDAALARAPALGRWTTLAAWFARLAGDAATLPVVRDELYLETHRGVATTHHDVKARNAALERAIGGAELLLAWAKALRATSYFLAEARTQLARAWELVLRAQFHDVLPGTSIAAVYSDVGRDYDEAQALVANVVANARRALPQATLAPAAAPVAPVVERGSFRFANAHLTARVARDGTLVELRVPDGTNLVCRGLRLCLYADRPRRWDAWNVDRSSQKRPVRVRVTGVEAVDGELEIRYAFGASLAVARVSLDANEPFLRVELGVAWNERRRLLRFENALAFAATRARFGTPHGAVDRAPAPRTRAERAKFEAPGQRFARLDGARGGLAFLTLDTYGWSLERRGGRSALGHSLLRAPMWPDPTADRGEHAFSFALVPFATLGMGHLETLWERFTRAAEVPMFTSDDPALFVAATKLADDGDGVIVRVRECDGAPRTSALRCGARVVAASCVDALERPLAREVALDDGVLRAPFGPYELRAFRVRLT